MRDEDQDKNVPGRSLLVVITIRHTHELASKDLICLGWVQTAHMEWVYSLCDPGKKSLSPTADHDVEGYIDELCSSEGQVPGSEIDLEQCFP